MSETGKCTMRMCRLVRCEWSPTVDVPLGARLEVLWPHRDGGLAPAWYKGTVTDTHTYASGRRRHTVTYDGYPDDTYAHDLASSDFQWRFLDAACPASASPAPRPGPVTRSRAAASAFAASTLAMESATSAAHVDVYNSIIDLVLDDDALPFLATAANSLDAARSRLLAASAGLSPACVRYATNAWAHASA